MFHVAVLIGNWLIEWNNSGICLPRKCASKSAVLSFGVESIGTLKNLNKVVDILAKTIVFWNSNRVYTTTIDNIKTQGDCQTFVDTLLHQLGVKVKFEGPMGEFISEMRAKGSSELKFKYSSEFKKKFGLNGKDLVFRNHKHLDGFVKGFLAKDPKFAQNHVHEYKYLRAIDKAYWIRFARIKEVQASSSRKLAKIQRGINEHSNMRVSDEQKSKYKQAMDVLTAEIEETMASYADVEPLSDLDNNVEVCQCPFEKEHAAKS